MTSEAWGSQPSSTAGFGASPSAALRQVLLWASRRRQIKRVITSAPVTRDVVRRFVAGETLDEAIIAARACNSQGMYTSLDYLGENVATVADAQRAEVSIHAPARGATPPRDPD